VARPHLAPDPLVVESVLSTLTMPSSSLVNRADWYLSISPAWCVKGAKTTVLHAAAE
jgi:hypothetical protein